MANVNRVGPKGKPKGKKLTVTAKSISSPKKGGGFLGEDAIKVLLYGPPGVGKTSFAAQFPACGFMIDSQERGIKILAKQKQVPEPVFIEICNTFSDSRDVIAGCKGQGIETLVVDSLTGFEKLCFLEHCEECYEGNFTETGYFAYQQGPKNAAKTVWPSWLGLFDDVVDAGINVVVIAHSTIKNRPNPEGIDWEAYTPYLDKEIWAQTHRVFPIVLFYNFAQTVQKESKNKMAKAKVDVESERRIIYTTRSPAWEAKNLYGLPDIILAGESPEESYQAFEEAFREATAD
jgi:DNA polymerase III delta prime subunit